MSDEQPKRPRGRPPVSDPLNITINLQVSQSMLDAMPKKANGKVDQAWLREAVSEKLAKEQKQ